MNHTCVGRRGVENENAAQRGCWISRPAMAHQSQLWCWLGHARLAIASTQLQTQTDALHENLLMQGIIPLCTARARSNCAPRQQRSPEYSRSKWFTPNDQTDRLSSSWSNLIMEPPLHSPEDVALWIFKTRPSLSLSSAL